MAAGSVAGTQWRLDVDDGHVYIFTFREGGECSYLQQKSPSGNEGKTYDNCRWVQNNKVVVFNSNQFFMTRMAVINGPRMRGHYATNWKNGTLGSFVGERVD